MARPPKDVTDAEVSILHVLWERGKATVREIAEELYSGRSASQQATVQKLLERLEGKDFVVRDRSQSVHTFRAAVCREELIGRRLRTVAEKLCGGSLTPLLTHLVRAERLSAAERQELRKLIDQMDQARASRGPSKKTGRNK